jgi:hypothetical protein
MDQVDTFTGFGDFGGRIWLNTARQGPLPLVAANEAREAIAWKLAPYELTGERFDNVPRRLRTALGGLANVPADEIVLGNSASYGLHLIANGYPWKALPANCGDCHLLHRNLPASSGGPMVSKAEIVKTVRRLCFRTETIFGATALSGSTAVTSAMKRYPRFETVST